MRILGIDIGSSSIKIVEVDSAFGRFDIHDYHESRVEPGVPIEETVSTLVKGLSKTPDRIVVSLPSGQTTFRNLQLPTRDKKAIQAGVKFELEDELPFPLEESLNDYAIINQTRQGSSIHVAATLKRHIVTALQSWENTVVSPDIVTTDAWAYRILMNRIMGPNLKEGPVLLVQIGHRKTILYLHWNGSPALIREVQFGGQDLTAAICQKYELPFEQAEALKMDRGFISHPDANQDVTPEQLELSECLEKALESIVLELKQVSLVTKSLTHQHLDTIFLAGGTSLLPGLGPWLEERLKTQTKPLLALSSITSSGVTYSQQTDAMFHFATALALTLVGPDRAICINFRKGEFSKEGRSKEINIKVLRKPLIAVGIVSFCLFLSLIVQSNVYKSRLKTTDAQLERSVKSFFGQMSASALRTYMSNTSTLRASITKELNKQRELSKLFGPNSHSPLDFLNSLSASIPKDVVLDMHQFQVGSPPGEPFSATDLGSANLLFTTSNTQTAERLSNYLNAKLTNLQKGKLEEDPITKKSKISFVGKPTEESYGK